MAYGDDIIDRVPPPDKLPKGGSKMPDGDEAPGESEADEDKAVRVSAMQDFMDAMKGDDAEAACDKLDAYLDIVGR